MDQRGLAASRLPDDQIERVLRPTAAEDVVELRNAGRQTFDGDFAQFTHCCQSSVFSRGTADDTDRHASSTSGMTRSSPMNVLSRPMSFASTAASPSAIISGSTWSLT